MTNFKAMSIKELRQYVLANRHDQEAWEEFTSRPRPNATIIPADEPPETMERILQEAISQPKTSGNTYNQSGNIGIGHMSGGSISGNAKIAGVINEAAQQDLTQAAVEIQQLLEQLSKTNPTETFAEKGAIADMTIQEIENNPVLKQKIISSLKAMGIDAFVELIDHPVANVLRAGIQGYRKPN